MVSVPMILAWGRSRQSFLTNSLAYHTIEHMTKAEALQYFGSGAELARRLGCRRQSVHGWREIPIGRQYQIEVLTSGALLADRVVEKRQEAA